jgi:lipoate-protein ligase A
LLKEDTIFTVKKSLKMIAVNTESDDPFFNLAAEEYLFNERRDDYLLLTVNTPCVIIGKHQVAHVEVDSRYTDRMNIPVIRRISGGGTVYHDPGNLNFAIIRQSEQGRQVDFRYYTKPVIDFLGSAGVNAVFEGKNDLTVEGLKISGNAEHVYKERVLHHGTLLFDASLENMRGSIKPKNDRYSTRGVESNRTSVTNLKGRLLNINTIRELKESMLGYFRETMTGLTEITLDPREKESIAAISESRYKTWEWNWAYGPPYTFTSEVSISGTLCPCRLYVKDGIIWECDLGGTSEINLAGKKLIGCRHMPEDIRNIFYSEGMLLTDDEVYGFF